MQNEKRWISSQVLFTAVKDQLAENRQSVFTVTGMSMWPFLCNGRDQVIVGKMEKEKLKKGDILLYCASENGYILHRVTCLKEDCFQTTGDGNLYRDYPLPYECIVAKVYKVVRNGKMIACSNIGWKIFSTMWMYLFPVRRYIFKGWFHIRKYIKR